MPRIRKKTSKRGTTHQRQKIKKKVAESRRKSKKQSKKDVTWKTKKAKDPGIPNNFPYKDQILAEIAEQRRQEAEAKQKKKEEKKAARAAASAEQDDEEEGSESGFDAVGTTTISAQAAKSRPSVPVEDEEDEVPILMNRDLPNLKAVLDKTDVLLEVLDARDPLPFRSGRLEKLVNEGSSKKNLVIVLNKIDTVPRETVASWANQLRTEHPTFLFRSASAFLPADSSASAAAKGKAKAPVDDGMGTDALLEFLGKLASGRDGQEPLVVAVVGLANAGKSALLNTLAKQAAFPIYKLPSMSATLQGPTTTSYAQEISLPVGDKQIRFIDTPGLSWESGSAEDEDRRLRDILLRSRGRIDKLKDPEPAVDYMVRHAEHEDLMLLYNLPAFIPGDTKGFLAGVARVNGLVKKGGVIDHASAARVVLRDWITGKIARYTSPPPSSSASASATDDHAKDQDVLEKLKTRKEMRTSLGLVKMAPGTLEDRMPVLEESWIGESESDEEQEEGGGVVDGEEDEPDEDASEGEGEDEDEDEDVSDDEEVSPDEVPSPAPGKRKRTANVSTKKTPPSKKVAFAALPKESKQSRSAGSMQGKSKSRPPVKGKLNSNKRRR